jgi:glycosyltransferase involved in cell wall biosynthesis
MIPTLPLESPNNPITVLHIFSGDLWAGAEVMISTLLASLKEDSNYEIVALALNEGMLSARLRDAGIEVYVIPEVRTGFLQVVLNAYKLLKRRKIDIIHSHRYKEHGLALLLSRMMWIDKLVATVHGLPEPVVEGAHIRGYPGLKTMISNFLLRRYFTRVIAVSEEMRDALVEIYGHSRSKLEVIYNGIVSLDCVHRHRTGGADGFHVGTVGRTVPVKDFQLFIDIAAELRKRFKLVRFSILGDGPLTRQLMDKAKALNVADGLQFVLPRPDPTSYYQSLDLYLNTSIHEGIPMSVLEAMAVGLPVVAPRVGGIPEMIDHEQQGLLVDSRRVGDFVDACTRLIGDEGLRTKLGDGAFHRVRDRFKSEGMARAYKRVYRNMLGQ